MIEYYFAIKLAGLSTIDPSTRSGLDVNGAEKIPLQLLPLGS